jgi:hypothetical protein
MDENETLRRSCCAAPCCWPGGSPGRVIVVAGVRAEGGQGRRAQGPENARLRPGRAKCSDSVYVQKPDKCGVVVWRDLSAPTAGAQVQKNLGTRWACPALAWKALPTSRRWFAGNPRLHEGGARIINPMLTRELPGAPRASDDTHLGP